MGVINKKSVIYAAYILLAARAGISGISPFGIAAYAAALTAYDMSGGAVNIILYASGLIIGSLLTGIWQQAVISAVTVILYTLSYLFLRAHDDDTFPFAVKCGAALALSNIIPLVMIFASAKGSIFDLINIIIRLAATFIMFFVYRTGEQSASALIDGNTTAKQRLGAEELACAAIILMVGLMGLPSLVIFGLSLRNMISICMIMSFSLRGGIGTGAAAGVMIGIITNPLSAYMICLYAFCGFLSGLFARMGKGGTVAGFVIGNIILTAVLGGTKESVYAMYETGFASILFVILPKRFTDFIKIPYIADMRAGRKISDADSVPARLDYAGKVRNAAIRRATFYSETLAEMSSEFMDISTAGAERVKEDPCIVRIHSRVCSGCKMNDSCWARDYRAREKTVLECMHAIERDDESNIGLTRKLGEICIRPEDMINEIKISVELQREEKICNAKISECRSLIVKQLKEMGSMSMQIADDIRKATDYDFEGEKQIINALKKHEIYIYDAVFVKGGNDSPEITLYTYKDYKKDKIDLMTKVISKTAGKRMQLFSVKRSHMKNGMKEMYFTVKNEISVRSETVCLPAPDMKVSGDSYLFTECRDGSSYCILSDGMGTGRKAAVQSGAAVHLSELYIKSGIDILSAASMVNMMLTSGASDVVTASMDICKIDRQSKVAVFVKMGAVPSVVVGKESSRIIEMNRPPAGVAADINDMYCKKTECTVSKGDCIVMYTDGVMDSFNNAGVNNKVFYEYISAAVRKHMGDEGLCHKAAEEIISKAVSLNEKSGYDADDMSVSIIEIV